MNGIMPKGWNSRSRNTDRIENVNDKHAGDTFSLAPNETKIVWFRNIYGRSYRLEVDIHVDSDTKYRRVQWVSNGDIRSIKVTNPFLYDVPVFTGVTKGSILDRFRYILGMID